LKLGAEKWPFTKEEAYVQMGHSTSLLKGILAYIEECKRRSEER
jgi:hypothetical protein